MSPYAKAFAETGATYGYLMPSAACGLFDSGSQAAWHQQAACGMQHAAGGMYRLQFKAFSFFMHALHGVCSSFACVVVVVVVTYLLLVVVAVAAAGVCNAICCKMKPNKPSAEHLAALNLILLKNFLQATCVCVGVCIDVCVCVAWELYN